MTREHTQYARRCGRLLTAALGLTALATLSGCHNGQVDAEAVGYVIAVPLIAFMYAAPFIFGWGRGGHCH